MRRAVKPVLVILLLVLGAALAAVPVHAVTYNYGFTVSVYSSGAPISGATVAVYTDSSLSTQLGSGTTDSSGDTTITLSPGTWWVVASASGYITQKVSFSFPASDSSIADFTESPSTSTNYIVVESSSGYTPISGASVGIYTDSSMSSELASGTTGGGGVTSGFSLQYPATDWVFATASGYGATGEYFGVTSSGGYTYVYLTPTPPPNIAQPITITVANGGASGTATLSGCSVSPRTVAMDGATHTVSATPSCSITIYVPTDGTYTRYRLPGGGTSTTVGTCSSGTCSNDALTAYEELSNTYGSSPSSPSTFDAILTISLTGEVAGSTGQTVCSQTTSSGGGSVSCSGWSDYGIGVSSSSTVADGSGKRWVPSSSATFTDTTGDNIHSVSYVLQLSNTYEAAPNAPSAWNGIIDISVTGTQMGAAGQTGCTLVTASGLGTVSCIVWFDYDTSVTIASTVPGSSGQRWVALASTVFTDTAPGNTHLASYDLQLQNTYGATPSSPGTWDAALGITVKGTQLGITGQTGCALITAPGGGAVSCVAWFDYDTLVTVASPLTISGSDYWAASGPNTFTQMTGSNTDDVLYVEYFSTSTTTTSSSSSSSTTSSSSTANTTTSSTGAAPPGGGGGGSYVVTVTTTPNALQNVTKAIDTFGQGQINTVLFTAAIGVVFAVLVIGLVLGRSRKRRPSRGAFGDDGKPFYSDFG